MDADEEAVKLLQEIESKFPPDKCSLEEYQEVLKHLVSELKIRIREPWKGADLCGAHLNATNALFVKTLTALGNKLEKEHHDRLD